MIALTTAPTTDTLDRDIDGGLKKLMRQRAALPAEVAEEERALADAEVRRDRAKAALRDARVDAKIGKADAHKIAAKRQAVEVAEAEVAEATDRLEDNSGAAARIEQAIVREREAQRVAQIDTAKAGAARRLANLTAALDALDAATKDAVRYGDDLDAIYGDYRPEAVATVYGKWFRHAPLVGALRFSTRPALGDLLRKWRLLIGEAAKAVK